MKTFLDTSVYEGGAETSEMGSWGEQLLPVTEALNKKGEAQLAEKIKTKTLSKRRKK